METHVEELFSEFFEQWVGQLEQLVQQLAKVSKERPGRNEAEIQILVSNLTAHHDSYYSMKWAQARHDVLVFFSPEWLSPLEKACSWMTGWKPSMAFRLVDSTRKNKVAGPMSLPDISEEQVKKIKELETKVKMEEDMLEREMERQQMAMADGGMVDLASRMRKGGEKNREVEGMAEVALDGCLCGLESIMKAADCVRLRCVKGFPDVLNPLQSLEFLVAISLVQIRLRLWGRERVEH